MEGVGVYRWRGECRYGVILLLKCDYPFPRLTPEYFNFVSFVAEVRNVFLLV